MSIKCSQLNSPNKVGAMKNLGFLGFSCYSLSNLGEIYSSKSNRFLSPCIGSSGYLRVTLTDDEGATKDFSIHRLVAFSFLREDTERSYVNHIDGNKLNNNVKNLEWVTASENNIHAYTEGLSYPKVEESLSLGIDPHNTKTSYNSIKSEEDIHTICRLLEKGYRDVDVCRMTNFRRRTIASIRLKEQPNYKKIVEQYNIDQKREFRLSPETVLDICKLLSQGCGVCDIARQTNTNRKQVGNIKNKKTFIDISCQYKWSL